MIYGLMFSWEEFLNTFKHSICKNSINSELSSNLDKHFYVSFLKMARAQKLVVKHMAQFYRFGIVFIKSFRVGFILCLHESLPSLIGVWGYAYTNSHAFVWSNIWYLTFLDAEFFYGPKCLVSEQAAIGFQSLKILCGDRHRSLIEPLFSFKVPNGSQLPCEFHRHDKWFFLKRKSPFECKSLLTKSTLERRGKVQWENKITLISSQKYFTQHFK